MKRIVFIAWFISTLAFGQTEYDFGRYLRLSEGLGSGRGVTMPGAIVVMGGDLQAAKVNPAGLGLYNRVVLAGTLGLYGTHLTDTALAGGDRGPRPEIADAGMVIPLGPPARPRSISGPWILAITWHKDAHHLTGASMATDGSMLRQWKNVMDGYAPAAFYQSSPFAMSLAEGLWTVSDSTLWRYSPVLPLDSSRGSTYRFEGNRGRSALHFAMGRQFLPSLFIGGAVAVPFDVSRTSERSEERFADSGGITRLVGYEEQVTSKAAGIRAGVGVIFRPTCFLRIGLSYYTPARMQVEDSIAVSLWQGTVSNGTATVDTPVRTAIATWNYRVTLPAEYRLSVGIIDGSRGAVTVGLKSVHYGNIRFTEADYPDPIFDSLNHKAAAFARWHHQVSVSGELKGGPWRLRGGMQWDATWKHRTRGGVGLGYHTPQWYADLGLYTTWQPQTRFTPFEGWNDGSLFSSVEGDRTTWGLSLTLGARW